MTPLSICTSNIPLDVHLPPSESLGATLLGMAESLNAGIFIVGSPLRPSRSKDTTAAAAGSAGAGAVSVYTPEGCLVALLRLWALGVQRRRSLHPIDPAKKRETEYMSVLVLQHA